MGWALKALTVSMAVRAVSMEVEALEVWERSCAMRGDAKDLDADWMMMKMGREARITKVSEEGEDERGDGGGEVRDDEAQGEGGHSTDVVCLLCELGHLCSRIGGSWRTEDGMIDCFEKSEQIELGSGDPAAGAPAPASAFDGDSGVESLGNAICLLSSGCLTHLS